MPIKINKYVFAGFILLCIFELILVFRYAEMGVMTNIIGFILVIFFSIFIFSISIQRWKEIINPISLYFLFIFGFGYSLLNLSKYVKPYSTLSIIVIILSIFSYISGALLNIRFKSPFNAIRFSQKSSLFIYYGILLISVISFLYEIYHIGYLPILKVFRFDIYNDVNTKLVSFVHYFVMLFGIFPAWTYILVKKRRLNRIFFLSVLLFSVFVILNYLSRQIIILLLLSFLVSYTFYNKVQIRKIIIFSILIIGVFFLIGQIRMAQLDSIKKNSGYTANRMLQNYAGIKSETNLIESTYTLYSSIRYNALNELINKARKNHYFGYGKYVFRPLVSIAFLDRIGIIDYESEYNVNSAVATYAIDPFLDFGILGVICFGFFYGLISTHFYTNYKSGKEQYIISWSIIIFCLIMTPFLNYFSSFFVFLVWALNKLIISE